MAKFPFKSLCRAPATDLKVNVSRWQHKADAVVRYERHCFLKVPTSCHVKGVLSTLEKGPFDDGLPAPSSNCLHGELDKARYESHILSCHFLQCWPGVSALEQDPVPKHST